MDGLILEGNCQLAEDFTYGFRRKGCVRESTLIMKEGFLGNFSNYDQFIFTIVVLHINRSYPRSSPLFRIS
jgi:hypothetical protein